MSPENPGWDQYYQVVLQQLENLSTGVEALRSELQDVKNQLTELKAKEDRIQDIKAWKERMDEVSSPTQLKELTSKVEDLGNFKTKSIGVFVAVQFFMGVILWYLQVF